MSFRRLRFILWRAAREAEALRRTNADVLAAVRLSRDDQQRRMELLARACEDALGKIDQHFARMEARLEALERENKMLRLEARLAVLTSSARKEPDPRCQD